MLYRFVLVRLLFWYLVVGYLFSGFGGLRLVGNDGVMCVLDFLYFFLIFALVRIVGMVFLFGSALTVCCVYSCYMLTDLFWVVDLVGASRFICLFLRFGV